MRILRCVQGSCIYLVRTLFPFSTTNHKNMNTPKTILISGIRRSPLFMLSALTALMALTSCHDTDDDEWGETKDSVANINKNDASSEPALSRLEFPRVKGNSIVLIHTTNDRYGINYSVEWDTLKKAQRWSAYQMTQATMEQNTSRYYSTTNQYPLDPLLPAQYYLSMDCYWNSGFDHGHLCPSYDRLYSQEANYQTFFLTNMQPQYKAFNGSLSGSESYKNSWSPWYKLEGKEGLIRTAISNINAEVLYVVKGGTIEDEQILPTLVRGEMRVPKYFFVALLLKNKEGYKSVGFWMEHKSSYATDEPLGSYAVNIAELEDKTGIDFFCNLPDDIEKRVETLPIENVKRAWGL